MSTTHTTAPPTLDTVIARGNRAVGVLRAIPVNQDRGYTEDEIAAQYASVDTLVEAYCSLTEQRRPIPVPVTTVAELDALPAASWTDDDPLDTVYTGGAVIRARNGAIYERDRDGLWSSDFESTRVTSEQVGLPAWLLWLPPSSNT